MSMFLCAFRRVRYVAAVLCATVVLCACAGLPQRGMVNVVPKKEVPTSGVVLDAKGPTAGATPEELIQGFLRASSVGSVDDYRIAREYLTPEAATRWNPTSDVSVFSDSDVINYSESSSGALIATVPALGSLDSAGRYTSAAPDSSLSRQFSLMVDENGEWRIATLDDSVMMAQTVFSSLYVRSTLYFLNAAGDRFVPELRWYPRSRAVALMSNALVAAPSEWMEKVAYSAYRVQSGDPNISVSVESSVAHIDLPASVASLSAQELGLLEAQFTKTLVGSGLVQDVVLTMQGAELNSGDVPEIQAYPYTSAALAAIRNGELVSISDGELSVLRSSESFDAGSFSSLAVDYSLPSEWAVGLNADRTVLTCIGIGKSDSRVLATGTYLAEPSIDTYGWAWTTDSSKPGQFIALNLTSGDAVMLDAPDLATSTTRALAVSREGARIVAVSDADSGGQLAAYAIRRDEQGVPIGIGVPMRFGQGLANIQSLAWISETRLLLVGSAGKNGTQSLVTLDVGGPREHVSVAPDVVSVAAGRSLDSAIVLESNGNVKEFSGSTWSDLLSGVGAIAFPG